LKSRERRLSPSQRPIASKSELTEPPETSLSFHIQFSQRAEFMNSLSPRREAVHRTGDVFAAEAERFPNYGGIAEVG
jgi:hypothetical protein